MCVRARGGNSGTLPAAMREMNSVEGRHATMHNNKTREPLVLFGRESTIGSEAVVSRHESSPRGDQIRDGNGEAGPGRRARAEPTAVKEPNQHHTASTSRSRFSR